MHREAIIKDVFFYSTQSPFKAVRSPILSKGYGLDKLQAVIVAARMLQTLMKDARGGLVR